MADIVEARVMHQRKPARRRGLLGQRRMRRRERAAREAAVAYLRCLRLQGQGPELAASHLWIEAQTLRRWERGWHRDHLAVRPRGRPASVAPDELRYSVYAVLGLFGPGIGVPALRRLFPDVGKRELEELVRRYRHTTCRGRRVHVDALRWCKPGTVWAMDYTDLPQPIGGIYDKVLCLRDLASQNQLWTLPTIGKATRTVLDSLAAQVRWHGAPLALKLDNDSVFRAEALKTWCAERGILLLYSPPRTPSYNGAAERGIGSLKVHAHYASARADRPGEWTCDDLEQARQIMNATGRPCGADGATPEALWCERTPVSDDERTAFKREYERRYAVECARRGIPWGVQLRHDERAAIDRTALAQTLTSMGYLIIRRRRITLPIRSAKANRIP